MPLRYRVHIADAVEVAELHPPPGELSSHGLVLVGLDLCDHMLSIFKRSRTQFRIEARGVFLQKLPGTAHMGFGRA